MVKNIFTFISFICMCLVSCSQENDNITFVRVDPYTKVFPESVAFLEAEDTVEIAAGEHAAFQFALHSPFSLKDVSIKCESFKSKDGNEIDETKAGFVGYVGVGSPADNRPHDALSSKTSLYPDPILNTVQMDIPCGQTTPVWISVKSGKTTLPGLYEANIKISGTINGQQFTKEKSVSLRVYPVVMEEPAFWNMNWYHETDDKVKAFCNGQDEGLYSDSYWKMLEALAKEMKDSYQNALAIQVLDHIGFTKNGDIYSFDFTNFDKVLGIFLDAGIDKMVVGKQFGDRARSIWTSGYSLYVPETKDGKTEKNLYPLEDPKVQNFYKQFIPAYMAHLDEKGLTGKYYQHIADEPIDQNSQSYISIVKFIKSLAPELKIIEACQSAQLEEVIDVWIPIINSYQSNYDFFKKMQEKGDEVWFYTCCYPRGEYANRFIEWPLIKTRLIYWIAFNYGATGYLHWGFNYWSSNPYRETTCVDDMGTTLPAGDCFIVYPDYKGGLNGSIRLEAVRQGVEDYTLLKMLEKKNPELARSLCHTVIKSWNSYNTDINYLNSVRHIMLQELSSK